MAWVHLHCFCAMRLLHVQRRRSAPLSLQDCLSVTRNAVGGMGHAQMMVRVGAIWVTEVSIAINKAARQTRSYHQPILMIATLCAARTTVGVRLQACARATSGLVERTVRPAVALRTRLPSLEHWAAKWVGTARKRAARHTDTAAWMGVVSVAPWATGASAASLAAVTPTTS